MGAEELIGLGLTAADIVTQEARNKKAFERNKEMMNIQKGHQKDLNRQGAELQHQMWLDTMYPAQKEQMVKAGLNPALMYGMKGGGGATTGSQSGGSAQSGQAPAPEKSNMGTIMMGLQMEMMKKEIESKDIDNQIKKGDDPAGRGQKEIKQLDLQNLLTESNIDVNNEQINLLKTQGEKLLSDTKLNNKIIELDYTENTGRNMWANLERFLSGEYGIDTYLGALMLLPVTRTGYKIGGTLLKGLKGLSKMKPAMKQTLKADPKKTKEALNKLKNGKYDTSFKKFSKDSGLKTNPMKEGKKEWYENHDFSQYKFD